MEVRLFVASSLVRGGFSVFAPESNEQNTEDFADIIAASKAVFAQYPYEKTGP